MPYPYKNADGKAIFGKDEEGKSKPKPKSLPPKFQPSSAHTHIFDEISSPLSLNGKMEQAMKLANSGLISKEVFEKEFGPYLKPEVLIPATEKKQYLWSAQSVLPVYVAPPQQIRATVYLDIPGLPKDHNKAGFAWSLNASHDYTETEVRHMLMDMFSKVTDNIVDAMKKEKNK
jgi:hypothetical protein